VALQPSSVSMALLMEAFLTASQSLRLPWS